MKCSTPGTGDQTACRTTYEANGGRLSVRVSVGEDGDRLARHVTAAVGSETDVLGREHEQETRGARGD